MVLFVLCFVLPATLNGSDTSLLARVIVDDSTRYVLLYVDGARDEKLFRKKGRI